MGDTIGGFGKVLQSIGVDNVFTLGQGFGRLAAAILALKGLEAIIMAINAAMSANPYVVLAIAIAAVVGAFHNLIHGMELGKESDVWNFIPEKLQNMIDASQKLKESYKELSDQNKESIAGVLAEYDGIREMADTYLEMSANYDSLTDTQKIL